VRSAGVRAFASALGSSGSPHTAAAEMSGDVGGAGGAGGAGEMPAADAASLPGVIQSALGGGGLTGVQDLTAGLEQLVISTTKKLLTVAANQGKREAQADAQSQLEGLTADLALEKESRKKELNSKLDAEKERDQHARALEEAATQSERQQQALKASEASLVRAACTRGKLKSLVPCSKCSRCSRRLTAFRGCEASTAAAGSEDPNARTLAAGGHPNSEAAWLPGAGPANRMLRTLVMLALLALLACATWSIDSTVVTQQTESLRRCPGGQTVALCLVHVPPKYSI
jgi:hypothetical protein